jgi:hypothetical protein
VLHEKLVGLFVGLRAGAVHRRTFAPVEHSELDRGGIDGAPHFAAERIDLANDLPLGNSPDGRVAAHGADRVARHRQERGFCSHPRGCERRFDPRVTGADNNDVELINRTAHARGNP